MEISSDKAITKLVRSVHLADHLSRSKSGTWTAKDSYFYRHGRSPESLAASIVKTLSALGLKVVITDKEDRFRSWPTTSYFVVDFKVTQ